MQAELGLDGVRENSLPLAEVKSGRFGGSFEEAVGDPEPVPCRDEVPQLANQEATPFAVCAGVVEEAVGLRYRGADIEIAFGLLQDVVPVGVVDARVRGVGDRKTGPQQLRAEHHVLVEYDVLWEPPDFFKLLAKDG